MPIRIQLEKKLPERKITWEMVRPLQCINRKVEDIAPDFEKSGGEEGYGNWLLGVLSVNVRLFFITVTSIKIFNKIDNVGIFLEESNFGNVSVELFRSITRQFPGREYYRSKYFKTFIEINIDMIYLHDIYDISRN